MFASVSAGINAPVRSAARRANQAVLEMPRASTPPVESDNIRQVKNREDGVRLMGSGHRVYKNYAPRAAIVKGRHTRCSNV